MNKIYTFFLMLVITMLLFTQCKKRDETGGEPTIPKGIVTGKVVAANNVTPIRRAYVFIADGDKIYSAFTDVNGVFSLEAAAGVRQLNIQTGNGKMFRTVVDVEIIPNQTTPLPGSKIQLQQTGKFAYVTGDNDKIETILKDTLGYTAVSIQYTAFANLATISQYDAVFINCSGSTSLLYEQTLADYVANGGSLYLSDYAVKFITGSYIDPSFNCTFSRPGSFIPDSLLCVRRTGNVTLISNAPVVSPSLQAYLNKNTIDISYDLPDWEMVLNVNTSFWEVMVTDQLGTPLLMRTNNFTNNSHGTVTVGSNNNWTTICHKPSGSNPVTITIPSSAVAAHLAHGDSMGECGNEDGSGRIYYTTFHNAHNGQTGPDVKNILQYMILNL